MALPRLTTVLLVAAAMATGCGGGDAAETSASAPEPSTIDGSALTAPTTSTARVDPPVGSSPASLPSSERADLCVARPEQAVSPDEFVMAAPPPTAEPVVPGATMVSDRGAYGTDARSVSTGIKLDVGAGDGTPPVRLDRDDDPIVVLDSCPATGRFVVSGDRVVIELSDPPGLAVVEVDAGVVDSVVSLDSPITLVASAHPDRRGAWVRIDDDRRAPLPGVHFFDAVEATMSPAMADERLFPGRSAQRFADVVDTGTVVVVALDGRLQAFDPDTFELVAASRLSGGALLDGLGGRLWVSRANRLVALDPATLASVASIPLPQLSRAVVSPDHVWFSTLDEEAGRASIGVVDPRTETRKEVAGFETYEYRGRGGEVWFAPVIRPVPGGVVYHDRRAGRDFFVATPA